MQDAVQEATQAIVGAPVVVTNYVTIAEFASLEGRSGLTMVGTPGAKPWTLRGMMQHTLDEYWEWDATSEYDAMGEDEDDDAE